MPTNTSKPKPFTKAFPVTAVTRPRPFRPPPRTNYRKRTATDRATVTGVATQIPVDLATPQKLIDSTAIVLNRDPRVVASWIAEARQELQRNARLYVDSHVQSVVGALADKDYDVARKGAEWAIEHISARDSDGRVERIVEVQDASAALPTIQIGIALGGLPPARTHQALPTPDDIESSE